MGDVTAGGGSGADFVCFLVVCSLVGFKLGRQDMPGLGKCKRFLKIFSGFLEGSHKLLFPTGEEGI
jgi:hypothetical protein